MNDNNFNNMNNSTTGANYNDIPNQNNNVYDLNQPPAELNNTPSMFEYQNNLSDVNTSSPSFDTNNNDNASFTSTNNVDEYINPGINDYEQDDSFITFGREDYINNYNKPKYDEIENSDYETSFESQLANSQNIYNNQVNYQQQSFNQQNFNQGYYQNYNQNFNQGYNQNYNQGYDQSYMYGNQQMYNQNLYNGVNTNMNNNLNMSGITQAEEITTVQRKKEKERIVRQDGLEKAVSRSSSGSGIATKIFLGLFYLLIIGTIAFFGYKFYLQSKKFYFNKNRIVMMLDSKYVPKVYSEGNLEDNTKYSWSSDDDNIVTVDDTGELHATGTGRTKIQVTDRKTGNTEKINVEVINPTVKQLEITEDEKNLKIDEKYTLVPLINGRSDVVAKYTWSSNDESIAKVDQDGVVTGVGEGRTKIVLTLEGSELTSEISIVVTK